MTISITQAKVDGLLEAVATPDVLRDDLDSDSERHTNDTTSGVDWDDEMNLVDDAKLLQRAFSDAPASGVLGHEHLLQGLTEADDMRPVTMVQDKQSAKRVLDILESLGPGHMHACDTEVANIDVKKVGPVGNGNVTCLSIYSGPDVDFGNGPYVWVDNLDSADGTLEYFRGFLESKTHKKVWHNYSFDRHVLFNPSTRINVQGLGGDTMHMARLWNTARFQKGGYSLEALSADLMERRKKPMKELFGVPKLKKVWSVLQHKLQDTTWHLQTSADGVVSRYTM
ncbi:hypothetical protein DYB34_006426 [Aphanomyces astaci]|nr:hypothetical protein DYB34_006426 [Aphanomyces astaci]